VPNADGNCIQKFDNEGNLLQQWGEMGEAEGQLQRPLNIALDAQGNIYVSENSNGRIQKFDPNGNFVAVYGPFDFPSGIAVDNEGYVYVVEVVLGRLQKLRLQ
jgi:DNA-binding beta-propeller fold protein YncE